MSPTVWLVLPTYNESENIESILDAITVQLEAAATGNWHVLVVDDNSPDGTGRTADRLSQESGGRIEVLHRPGKEGLGRAYVAGFKHALAGGAQLVIQMDADFSHDPKDIPRLLSAAESADVVIGSRYAAGGMVRDWGTMRRVLSRGGCRYASTILGAEVADLTGGFKCLRRRTLELIELDTVKAEGYVFQIEVTYRALLQGLNVVEVPIVFRDRRAGTSKMSSRIAIEAMWAVLALRRRVDTPSVVSSANES
ncbi:MAG: polyprenol monophosphomannose synthase [Solirubrobacterales bacterium]|nr:polyprenol monophosphomannose synthase [Solirubrobacterales bacterium]